MRTLEDELFDLLDQGLIFDRSEKPLRPTITIVGSSQGKRKDESIDDYDKRMRVIDVSRFIQELWKKYPNARLVLADKSPAERAAMDMAELLEMPVELVEQAPSDAWDAGVDILDERIVARATHVVTVDKSGRSEHYKKLAQRTSRHLSEI